MELSVVEELVWWNMVWWLGQKKSGRIWCGEIDVLTMHYGLRVVIEGI